ncbi:remorin 4.2-like [Bidens hawaiensis]|uniref:remorin 4.2-like n=1 Tax=Bidens hawaiensis TaxID=980011 RepID=UPI00404A1C13
MSNYQVVARQDSNHSDNETFMRDIHALSPPSIRPPPVHHPLQSYLSMATSDQMSRDDFSVTSVDNSTLVVAGSVAESIVVENDRVDGMLQASSNMREVVVPVTSVKKEEVESKISAWKNAKIAEITNRFECEDAIIKGWESEQVQKATLKMKQVERKLEEKKARAMERMENKIAKAHRKAEERRASAESVRGTKTGRVIEVANLMKAVGRAPAKSFF